MWFMEIRRMAQRGGAAWPAVARRELVLVAAALSAGCQTAQQEWREGPREASPGASAAEQREVVMNGRWQNRPVSELTTTLGEPRLVLQIPGGGSPPGVALVYEVDPGTGCLDAFAVAFGIQPLVRVYHCR